MSRQEHSYLKRKLLFFYSSRKTHDMQLVFIVRNIKNRYLIISGAECIQDIQEWHQHAGPDISAASEKD